MAQTGYTPILIYSSSTVSQAPSAGNLTNSTLGSELAINITDGKLFYKDNANVVQVIGWKVVPTTAGGTGLTSYAQGDLLYYNSGTTLTALAKSTTATRYLSNTGTNNNPAWAQVDLTNGVTGTLPVGNGGTGTATAFTAGSVVFAGASGVFSQDNANFFWDDTNNRLGIGTTSPTGRLEMVTLAGDAEAYGTIYSATGGNEFSYLLRKSNRNTVGNTATANGDRLGALYWQGNSGSGFTPAARIRSVQVGAASTQTPAEIKFETSNGTSFTEKLNIAPGGNVTVSTGNLVIGTSGKGIDFSATSGTGTSELLADYEEGEWTAAFVPSTSGSITMNNATGTYTKIGRTVTINGLLTVTSVSSPVGYLQITGLPFSNGANAKFRCALAINNETMNATMTTTLVANVQGGTIIYVFKNDGAGGIALTTAADVKAGTNIFIGGTYTTE